MMFNVVCELMSLGINALKKLINSLTSEREKEVELRREDLGWLSMLSYE